MAKCRKTTAYFFYVLTIPLLCITAFSIRGSAEDKVTDPFLDAKNKTERELLLKAEKEASQMQRVLDEACVGASISCQTPAEFALGLEISQFDKAQDCRPLSVKTICARAPAIQDETKLEAREKRFASTGLRKEIFGYAQKYFDQIRSNTSFQERCCKDVIDSKDPKNKKSGVEKCRERFKNTRLYLLKGLGTNNRTIYSTPTDFSDGTLDRSAIYFSESALLNCTTEQCVENPILHEFGHVCQYSRYITLEQLMAFGGEEETLKYDLEENDLKAIMGSEVKNCIVKKLELEIKNVSNAIFQSWLKEALADIVFYSSKSDPAHWSEDCNQAVDAIHGPTRVQIECALKIPAFRKAICGK